MWDGLIEIPVENDSLGLTYASIGVFHASDYFGARSADLLF